MVGVVPSPGACLLALHSAQTPAAPLFVSRFGYFCTFEARFGSWFGMR